MPRNSGHRPCHIDPTIYQWTPTDHAPRNFLLVGKHTLAQSVVLADSWRSIFPEDGCIHIHWYDLLSWIVMKQFM